MIFVREAKKNKYDLLQPPRLPQEPAASMALSTSARDDGELRKMVEDQLKLQRELSTKLMKEV